jgi:hypothetical protein
MFWVFFWPAMVAVAVWAVRPLFQDYNSPPRIRRSPEKSKHEQSLENISRMEQEMGLGEYGVLTLRPQNRKQRDNAAEVERYVEMMRRDPTIEKRIMYDLKRYGGRKYTTCACGCGREFPNGVRGWDGYHNY